MVLPPQGCTFLTVAGVRAFITSDKSEFLELRRNL